uniref:Helix-turn-helix domain n=1 Tax=Candidatus Kentrum sp. SD TaxID=2126332 RepID=A0A451BRX7_9GAMM|nr:MAG: Helix-turn-helix domain [Candidatus Kentron sp. SD]
MILSINHCNSQALNDPLAHYGNTDYLFTELCPIYPLPPIHQPYRLQKANKKEETKSNVFDETTILRDGFFQDYIPNDWLSRKKINTKVVKVGYVKEKEPCHKKVEVLFFKQMRLKRIETFIEQSRAGKRRFYKGRCFRKIIYNKVLWVIKTFYLAFGKVTPSYQTIADILQVHRNTVIKRLQELREWGVISWKSGKKTFETNTYYLNEAYMELIIPRPEKITLPRKIHYAFVSKMAKAKGWLKTKLMNHFSIENVHHKLIVYLFSRTSIEKRRKDSFKSSKDPPPKRKKPPNWQLLRPFKLSFKDQWVIGRYSEALLRSAIDDYNFYKKQGKEIVNIPAFLISRCKTHKEKLDLLKKENRTNVKDWITSYFKSRGKRFIFIAKESDLDHSTSEQKPFIQFLKHKADIKKSILKVWQKVGGQWTDKVFNFDRPDLADSIENYLENSLKFQGK